MGGSLRRSGIKHNDLTAWFLEDHAALPASYLASCQKFFDGLRRASKKKLTSSQAVDIGNSKKGKNENKRSNKNNYIIIEAGQNAWLCLRAASVGV